MENKKRISVYTTYGNIKSLKIIAAERRTTITDLLNIAIREIIISEDIENIINKYKKPQQKEGF